MKKPSPQMTAELVKKIKKMLASNLYYQHQIAALVGLTNQGRISETKHGKYDHLLAGKNS